MWRSLDPRRALRGRLVRRGAVVISGTVVGQAALAVSALALARIYSPADLGVFAVFFAIVSLGYIIGSARYEQAVVLPASERDAVGVLVLALGVGVLTTALVSLGVVFAGDLLVDATDTPGLEPYLWTVPVTLYAATAFQALTTWAVRRSAFRVVATSRGVHGVVTAVAQIGLGLAGYRPVGLLIGAAVGWASAALVIAVQVVRDHREELRSLRSPDLVRLAKRYRRFPLFGVWSGLANRAALEVPAFALTLLYGTPVAGQFLLCWRVVAAPSNLVSTAVGQVYMHEASVLARESPDRLPVLFRNTWRRMAVLTTPPGVVLLVAGPVLFSVVFGDEWREAGVFAALLSPVLVLMTAVTPISATFAILERQHMLLVRDLLRLALVIGGFVLVGAVDGSPNLAVITYGVAMGIGYLTLFAFGRREADRAAAAAQA